MTSISSNYSGYSNYSNYSNSSSSSSSSSSSRPDMKSQLESLGIPDSVISQGPDAVKSYAEQNGITLPAPPPKPNENSSINGNSTNNNSPSEEFKQKLESLGIPSSVISQGREAVMQYAQENNIEMPAPPTQGGSLDIQA